MDKQNIEGIFYIVSALLIIVVIVLAAVGGLGLMGTTFLWLILIMVLGAVASLLPALNAARLTVREVLAYE